MIERSFVSENLKEQMIEKFIESQFKMVGHSHTKVQKTPLGEKIVIYASRPGLIVGKKGQNIKKLTKTLKKKFDLENPQIEISEVTDINSDPKIVAERIANSLERFGIKRFKGIGHKAMEDVMNAGALGVEILVSGKVPSSRAKRWRFYQGYLKKCGDLAISGVKSAYTVAQLKTGSIGIQVRIMPSDIKLPDNIQISEEKKDVVKENAAKKEAEETKEKVSKQEKNEDSGNTTAK